MDNFDLVQKESLENRRRAKATGLMYGHIESRHHAKLGLRESNNETVNFANCSYLGLDTDPRVIDGAKKSLDRFGVNFCVARTRLSLDPLRQLEEDLAEIFRAPTITFPSLTVTHYNVLPLLASSVFNGSQKSEPIFVFDKFAHASMKSLIPSIQDKVTVKTLAHNDLETLESMVKVANRQNRRLYFFCDSVYSMGGAVPIEPLINLLQFPNFFLYADDAHGTSIFGDRGQGFLLSELKDNFPENVFVAFSLTKGFGASGGGIATRYPGFVEKMQTLGLSYQFSGGMDFAAIGAATEIIKIHRSSDLAKLQEQLWDNVALFDDNFLSFGHQKPSPIRMVRIGDEKATVDFGNFLLENGFYVPSVFFPVVPRGAGQLRICLNSRHKECEILQLIDFLRTRKPVANDQ